MKKHWKKRIAAFLLAAMACVSLASPVSAAEEGWRKDRTGWWYQDADGGYAQSEWRLINNHWYYFDPDGYMATGWRLVNNRWRYFVPETWDIVPQGAMVTGFRSIDDDLYYFDEWGGMFTGEMEQGTEVYGFDENGRFSYVRPLDTKGLLFDYPDHWMSTVQEDLLIMSPMEGNYDGANILILQIPMADSSSLEQMNGEEIAALLDYLISNMGYDMDINVSNVPVEGTQANQAEKFTVRVLYTASVEKQHLISTLWLLEFDNTLVEVCFTSTDDVHSDLYGVAESIAESLTVSSKK